MGDKGIRQVSALIFFTGIFLTQEAIRHAMPLTTPEYAATAMLLCEALSSAAGTSGRAIGVIPGTETAIEAAG